MSVPAVGALAASVAACVLVLAIGLRGAVLELHLDHPDSAALREAAWSRGLGVWEVVRACISGLALALCLVTALPLLLVVGAAIAPSIWIRLRAEAVRERASTALGRVIASAEASLRAGASLPAALRRAAESCGEPLMAAPIEEAVRAFDLGAGLEASLTAAAGVSRDGRVRLALGTIALGIAERLPRERLADLLAQIGDRAEFEDRLASEVRARAAGARQQQRLLALLVPLIAVYLSITVPSLAATLGSDLGRFVLIPAAAMLEITGIVAGRRIVQGALA